MEGDLTAAEASVWSTFSAVVGSAAECYLQSSPEVIETDFDAVVVMVSLMREWKSLSSQLMKS